jgi:hypothetical protein
MSQVILYHPPNMSPDDGRLFGNFGMVAPFHVHLSSPFYSSNMCRRWLVSEGERNRVSERCNWWLEWVFDIWPKSLQTWSRHIPRRDQSSTKLRTWKPWKAIPIARLASNLIDDLTKLYQRFHTLLYEILVDVRWSYLDYIKRQNYWHLQKTLESEGTMKLIAERKTALSWPPTSPFQIACTGIVFGVVFWTLLLVLQQHRRCMSTFFCDRVVDFIFISSFIKSNSMLQCALKPDLRPVTPWTMKADFHGPIP